jgi:hypothetical protein
MAVKQRQSQKQNVNVNINLGEKKRKRKPRKRKTVMKRREGPQPLFNPPSIINFPPAFNQPPAINLPPPPIPQKQYSVFPEGETATQLGLLSTVPVPLTFEGTTLKEKAKEPKPEAYKVINEPFKAPEEEYQLIDQPLPPPPFVEPAPELAPAEPPSPSTLSTISEGENIRNALRFVEETGQPFTFPSPKQYSSLSTPSSDVGGRQIEEFVKKYNVPPPALSTISQSLPLPEIPKRTQKGLSAFFPILEGTAPPEPEKKKAGRPKGSTNKPKYEALVPEGQVQFAVPVKETVGQSVIEPYAEPPAIFLGGSTEKTFSLAPPEKISGGLEKQRRETALTPAEQTLLSNPLGI